MAIGVDIGAHGATTCDDAQRGSHHVVDSSRRRVVADLKNRIGDPVPMIFWDSAGRVQLIHPHELYAGEVLRVLLALGHDAALSDGRGIAVAVPAWWTDHATEMTRRSLTAGLGAKVSVVSDAVAAVRGLRAQGAPTDDVVAVLDLGARTTSAAVVRRCTTSRPEVVGRPSVHVDGAGDELDSRLLHHLLHVMRDEGDEVPEVSTDTARELLAQCHEAKHALSTRSATTFSTTLTGEEAPVRLVRDELDEIALPWARIAARVLSNAIESSQLPVRSVLVVGGGARVPLISQTISAELALEVISVDEPAQLVARGAHETVAGIDHTRVGHLARWRSRMQRRKQAREVPALAAGVALAIEATTPPSDDGDPSSSPSAEREAYAS